MYTAEIWWVLNDVLNLLIIIIGVIIMVLTVLSIVILVIITTLVIIIKKIWRALEGHISIFIFSVITPNSIFLRWNSTR